MSNILVVDDTRENLRLLSDVLTGQGYLVRPVPNGPRAISSAQFSPPDLILLDILMPDMDGYEVCRRLKADECTRDVPVIFISALQETFDKVKAFELGGVDYVTKPFQEAEVLARVKTHLRIRDLQQRLEHQNTLLQENNTRLQQEIPERKRAETALREANASKDTFFSIISHDLRSPFSAVLGLSETVIHYIDEYTKEEIRDSMLRIQSSSEAVYSLLENLFAWSRLQRGVLQYRPIVISLHDIVEENLALFNMQADQKQLTLTHSVQEGLKAYADGNMLNTIIRNLVSNALKFTESGGSIEISGQDRGEHVEVAVSDTGAGIPPQDIQKLFRIDAQYANIGTGGERGTGLGLNLCHDLVERNGGKMWVKSSLGKGTTFKCMSSRPEVG